MKRLLPNHIKGTVRAWRVRKRREWRNVEKALDQFLLGAAYTPIRDMGKRLEDARQQRKLLRGNWKP